jgi:hypothetical protein
VDVQNIDKRKSLLRNGCLQMMHFAGDAFFRSNDKATNFCTSWSCKNMLVNDTLKIEMSEGREFPWDPQVSFGKGNGNLN